MGVLLGVHSYGEKKSQDGVSTLYRKSVTLTEADLFSSYRRCPLTASTTNIAKLLDSPKSALVEWLETPEKHEQVAVGEKAQGSRAETQGFFNDVEKEVDGLPKWWSK